MKLTLDRIIKICVLVGIFVVLTVVVAAGVVGWFFGLVAGLGVVGVSVLALAGLAIWWYFESQKKIGPNELGVWSRGGEAQGVLGSGTYFLPLLWFPNIGLVWELEIFPKKRFNLDYTDLKVVTKAGKYPEKTEPGEPEGVVYNVAPLEVDASTYIELPREIESVEKDGKTKPPGLLEIQASDVPLDEPGLAAFSKEAIEQAVSVGFGGQTWMQSIQDRAFLNKKVNEVFILQNGALMKAGFSPENITIVIREVRLPKDLKDSLTDLDRARIAADKAIYEARQEATENVGALVQMLVQTGYGSENEVKTALRGNRRVMKLITKLILDDQLMKGGGTLFRLDLPPNLGSLDQAVATFVALNKGLGGGGVSNSSSGGGSSGSAAPTPSGPKVKTTPEQLAQGRKELAEDQARKKLEQEQRRKEIEDKQKKK